jgi:hypothetical protein
MGGSDLHSLRTVMEAILGSRPGAPGKGTPRGERGEKDGKEKPGKVEPIVNRRDEKGLPYPGDFPNPASDRTRGCF